MNFNKNSSDFAKCQNLNETHGKYHCNARITSILSTCWEAADCHTGVAVSLHAYCNQSFVMLVHGDKRSLGTVLGSPGGRDAHQGAPNPSRSSAELCSCFPALVLNIPCGVFSASTFPVCQASLLWPFFFFNQSPLSAFAPVGAFLFPFVWFPRHPAASSVVACLHHPKLCSFFHVFMAGICRANINPLVAHG